MCCYTSEQRKGKRTLKCGQKWEWDEEEECEMCGRGYEEKDDDDDWIGCERCTNWIFKDCLPCKFDIENDDYVCSECQ